MLTRRHLIALTLAALTPARAGLAQDIPVIAAASDLQFVLPEIAKDFTAETGQQVQITFGSTGNFARQIREGAPFQMFLAADESFIAALHAEGLTLDEGRLYALGRIVLIAPEGAPFTPDETLTDLAAKLADNQITRFAIANPEHAPYGARAKEALIHAGLWDAMQPRLVLGENVSQAAQFALSGNADGGIIAYSLALAPDLRTKGHFALIPEDWHAPLRQRMALMPKAGPVAKAFYAYLQSPKARARMQDFGFTLPSDG